MKSLASGVDERIVKNSQNHCGGILGIEIHSVNCVHWSLRVGSDRFLSWQRHPQRKSGRQTRSGQFAGYPGKTNSHHGTPGLRLENLNRLERDSRTMAGQLIYTAKSKFRQSASEPLLSFKTDM